MNTRDLNTHLPYRYRVGRAGRDAVQWQQWELGMLYVCRREKDLPQRYRKGCRYWRSGDITTLTPVGKGWAEFSEGDYMGDGVFMCEDYLLEIDGLTDSDALDDMCKFMEENNVSFVFWTRPNGCQGMVTWNEDKTDATCDMCGRKRSDEQQSE